MALLRTYIIEDSPVIRENLSATLEELVPLQVVGFADDESTAVKWLRDPAHCCELGIVDLFLRHGSGLGVLQALQPRTLHPRSMKLVVFSNYTTPDMRRRCLALGADMVFDKSNEIDALIHYCEGLAASDGMRDGMSGDTAVSGTPT